MAALTEKVGEKLDNEALEYPPQSPVRIHPALVDMQKQRQETAQVRKMWQRSKSDLVALPPIKSGDSPVESSRQSLQSASKAPRMCRSTDFNIDRRKHRRQERVRTPDFNALNRSFVPIPRLYEGRSIKREYGMKSIEEWRNQVIKKVPDRPNIAISSDWVAPPAVWEDGDFFIHSTKPAFYQNIKYVTDKNYTVNPEWISEKSSICDHSPVYRTCALRYGWSC